MCSCGVVKQKKRVLVVLIFICLSEENITTIVFNIPEEIDYTVFKQCACVHLKIAQLSKSK
jgi:hypothetical protein